MISLTGVNVESNPEMEVLLGVRLLCLLGGIEADYSLRAPEKVHIFSLHVFQLVCTGCSKPEGAPSMDNEAGPHPTSFMTYHDLSRYRIYTYAFYFYFSSASTFIVTLPVTSCPTRCSSFC